jgi:micrococcal nuclease
MRFVKTLVLLVAGLMLADARGTAQPTCKKGKPCGNSCIAANKICRKAPGGTEAGASSSAHSPQNGARTPCRVTRIVDGDTMECDRRKIRLLLIDTPERKQAPFGRQATDVLRRLAPVGSTVRLEFDVDRTDRYGRELAYVYTSDGRFINEAIAREGYAVPLVYPPNVRHVERIRAAYEAAKAARTGLWAVDAFSCLPADARRGRCG